jgi:hypothetical protein
MAPDVAGVGRIQPAFAEGLRKQFGCIAQPEFAEHVAPVFADGRLLDRQAHADFPARQPPAMASRICDSRAVNGLDASLIDRTRRHGCHSGLFFCYDLSSSAIVTLKFKNDIRWAGRSDNLLPKPPFA